MEFNDAGTQGSFKTDLFNYNIYDRTSNVSFMTLVHYFEWIGVDTVSHPHFIMSSEELFRSRLSLFYTIKDYNISSKLYELAKSYRYKNFDVVMKTRFLTKGKSSVSLLATMTHGLDSQIIATMHSKCTVFDVEARRKHILPESTHKLLEPHEDQCKAIENFVPSSKPASAFEYTTTIRPSDTDFNGHTNSAAYIGICLDAASTASHKGGIFKKFSGDVMQYPVKRARMWYAQETFVGDLLSVFTWEDSVRNLSINFQVEKEDKVIYYATLSFFPKLQSNL